MLTFYYVILALISISKDVELRLYFFRIIGQLPVLYISLYYLSRYTKEFIHVLFGISELLTYFNLLTIILFPNGMYESFSVITLRENWLLGYRNTFFTYYVVFIVVGFIYREMTGKKIRFYLLIFEFHYQNA